MSKLIGGAETPEAGVKAFKFTRFGQAERARQATEFFFRPLPGVGGTPAMTIAEAHKEAERIKAQAQEEAARLRAQAFEQGLSEGRAQGQAAFEAEAAQTLVALKAMEDLYEDLWKKNEGVLVKLAEKIAERVVYHEVATSPELVAAAFRAAVAQLSEQHQATFRVHPEDLRYLESVREELKEQLAGLVKISFEPDPDLNRGDVILETEAGRVDATLKRRLEAVSSAVDKVLQGGPRPRPWRDEGL